MEFLEILRKRRSVRKFTDRPVPGELIDRLLEAALTATSARNTRSTLLLPVTDRALIDRMAQMRDYGSAFLAKAPLAVVVAGDPSACDVWRENAAITATILQLACVDAGLASCWVHVDGRPRRREEPAGEQALDYLRTLLPLPEGCGVLCVVAAGYSDFEPAPLPAFDPRSRILSLDDDPHAAE